MAAAAAAVEVAVAVAVAVVQNQIEWFILVTFKSHIPKGEAHELDASSNTLSMYCVRNIRITSEDAQVYLSKSE